MSQQDVVRIPFERKGPASRRRRLDDRIVVRAPVLAQLTAALAFGLPRRSTLRRRLLLFLTRRASAAVERADLELLMRVMYHPAAELRFAGRFADFDQTYRGREAAFAAYRAWIDSWEEYRREPKEIVDLGDRVLVLVRESGRGTGSGTPTEAQIAMLLTFRRGRVVKHQEFFGWDEALETFGLSGHR
ncbi:MAG: nuclear transport factor 2 family protein [Haloechinothrix sp.]